nr:LysM peptidoglycan-binding domain-containing protein [Bacillus sp. REN3]
MKEIEDDDQLDVAAPASSGEGASIEGKEGSSDSPDKDGEKATDSTAGKEKPAESNPAENRTDAGQVSKPAEDQSAAEETIIYHTVQPKETLFRVAMKYYNSQEGIAIIRKANNLQGNDIQAGQVLKIPLKK